LGQTRKKHKGERKGISGAEGGGEKSGKEDYRRGVCLGSLSGQEGTTIIRERGIEFEKKTMGNG